MATWLRLGVLYAAMNLAYGVATPFAAVWFKAHGLDGKTIGLVLAAPMLGRVLTGPAVAVFAEGFAVERTGIALVSAGAALAYALMPTGGGAIGWGLLWFAGVALSSSLNPLTDAAALRAARAEGFNYGRPRSLGSAAFIVAVIGGGAMVERLGAGPVMPAIAACMTLCAAAAWLLLPRTPPVDAHPLQTALERWSRVGRLARSGPFMLAIGSAGLINAAHAFYYSFSTLTWRGQGIDAGATGLLWGFGIVVEVAFLWFGEPLRQRIGPERLLVAGGVASVFRWSACALSPPLWLLVPLQALHVLTFAATFVASLQLAEKFSPPEAAASAQTLNNALASGLLIGLATLASGVLFDAIGARGYWAMAAVAALGLAGAVWLAVAKPAVAPGRYAC